MSLASQVRDGSYRRFHREMSSYCLCTDCYGSPALLFNTEG